MRSGEHEVARAYVLYREKRKAERASASAEAVARVQEGGVSVNVTDAGVSKPLDIVALHDLLETPAPAWARPSAPSRSSRKRSRTCTKACR